MTDKMININVKIPEPWEKALRKLASQTVSKNLSDEVREAINNHLEINKEWLDKNK